MVTAVVTSFAYLIPRNLLRSQANSRLNRILKGLPDALDIIRMCLTGGLPLRDALLRVAREIDVFDPDVSVELEVVRRHAEADTMAKALKEFRLSAIRVEDEFVSRKALAAGRGKEPAASPNTVQFGLTKTQPPATVWM